MLKVVKWRGYFNNDHPNNLLKPGSSVLYQSVSPAKGDWIDFEVIDQTQYVPSSVVITNFGGSEGLKSVRVMGSADGNAFDEWISLSNIKRKNKVRQTFAIDKVKGNMAQKKRYTHFKLMIDKNRGNPDENRFFEFAMFGKKGLFITFS